MQIRNCEIKVKGRSGEMKTVNMQLATFEKKLTDPGFAFHYASFKGHGWSSKHLGWIMQDLEYCHRVGETGLVRVRFQEPEDIARAKKDHLKALKRQQQEFELRSKFKFSFGYSITIPNSLTVNKYFFGIDRDNMILKRSWNSVTSYHKLSQKELQEHLDKYANIK